MRVLIKPSKEMDAKTGADALFERRVIRAPKDFREFVEIELGDFLDMRTVDGTIMSLAVEQAYERDAKEDTLSAYVTSEIYKMLVGDAAHEYDVTLVDGITLGCDPELLLIDRETANVVNAGFFFNKWDAVGYDGLMLELRPMPSTNEDVVVSNLWTLIQHARKSIDVRIAKGGWSKFYGYTGNPVMITAVSAYRQLTVGFHLHYGLPKELLGWPKRFIANQIVKVMDYYVGIPAIIPEQDADSHRRTVPYMAYGKPGDYRIDNRTLEYRVAGASLMRSPVLARGIMALGAVVMEDITSRIRHYTDGFVDLHVMSKDEDIRKIYPKLPPAMTIFSTICSPSIAPATRMLGAIRRDVEKMVGYRRRAKSIDAYFNTIENNVNFSPNVEENWGRYYHGQRQSGQVDVLRSSI